MSASIEPNLYPSPTRPKLPTVVVAEGVPPVSCRLVEKIRKWEFINMADLLKENAGREPQFMVVNGQLVAVQSQMKSKAPLTILKWLQAFNIFMAVLLSCEDTSKEEAAGLAAHSFLIVQLSEDLQGPQWLHYDQNFREWAAAKGLRKWGELNLTIYGRCLATNHPSPPLRPTIGSKRKAEVPICFRWNDGAPCSKPNCRYSHICRTCGGLHKQVDCPKQKAK